MVDCDRSNGKCCKQILYCSDCLESLENCKCLPFVGHFKCMKCPYVFHATIGQVECPQCESLYLEWKNYSEGKPLYCRICKREFVIT